jgi:hypothetical protein
MNRAVELIAAKKAGAAGPGAARQRRRSRNWANIPRKAAGATS